VKANSHRFVGASTAPAHLRSQLPCTLDPFIPRSKPAATRDHADPPRSRFDFIRRTRCASADGLRALGQEPLSLRDSELTRPRSRLGPATDPQRVPPRADGASPLGGAAGHTSETHRSPKRPHQTQCSLSRVFRLRYGRPITPQ
jgi:hypothetical protein